MIHWDSFTLFPLKTVMDKPNFGVGFGDINPPSPQIIGLLIKATFPFYQHFPLEYCLLSGKQPNLSLVTVSTPGIGTNKFHFQRLRKIKRVEEIEPYK